MNGEPLIVIEQVEKHFAGVRALAGVSFSIHRGEFHAIVGENGAGKSTLMKILAGIETDYAGTVRVRGEPLRCTGPRDAEQAGISIIHQELNLVSQISVAGNLFLGRERRTRLGLLDDAAHLRLAQGLFRELECEILPSQLVGELRVGDQQLVEIAKALSLQSEILIMDEPTSALTEAEVARLDRVIARLRSRGVTILYISHKLDEVFRLADRITVLRDGKHIATVPRQETSPREIVKLMVGREIATSTVPARQPPGDVVLSVKGLSLPWPGHSRGWRLRNIHLEVRRGEVLGLAGLLGAGRTELLEALFGASESAPRGEIVLAGQRVRFRHPAEACAAGMAFVTEDRKRLGLFDKFNVRENITLSQLRSAARAGWINAREETRLATEMTTRLHVKSAGLSAPVLSLSGGNQQKCIVGRWLLTRPRLLLLDDPTRGVDVGAKSELYHLIDELCAAGLAVIVTSSELPELLRLSDRIVTLCEGEITGEFPRASATEQQIMEAATRLKQPPA